MAVSKSVSSKTIVRAEINGSEIAIKKGSATFGKQLIDTTGSMSQGWQEFIVGNRGMTFTISGDVKKDAATRVIDDTKAVDIPANSDDESIPFKLYFSDGGGVTGVAVILCSLDGDPQSGAAVGWTMNGTANGAVTKF